MRLLSIDYLLQLHALSIHRYGGGTGVRDIGRVEAALATQIQEVFGQELYSTLEQKAAALMRNVIADHPFIDGNKRTATLAALTLIELDGREFIAKPGELEDFAVRVAVEQLDIDAVAAWLSSHNTQRT